MPDSTSKLVNVPVVTLDGPGGVGKGTIAQALANHFDWHYLESGALYRSLGLLAERHDIALDDEEMLSRLAANLDLSFSNGVVFLGDEALDDQIRTEQSGERASQIARLPKVRATLLIWQQRCARPPGLVAEGRDMGTVVFPGAECKIFLTASAQVRAERRFQQLKTKGFDVNISKLLKDIRRRDQRDMNRAISPLKCAADAFELDATEMSINEVVAVVIERMQICIEQVE